MTPEDCFGQRYLAADSGFPSKFGLRPKNVESTPWLQNANCVYRLFKVYPSCKWLVGYYKTLGEVKRETSYLDRFEREPVEISYEAEEIPVQLVPEEVKILWKREADEARLTEERAMQPMTLPHIRGRNGWPTLLSTPPSAKELIAEANRWAHTRPIRKPQGRPIY